MTLILFASIWKFPTAAPIIGVLLLITSLAIAISSIFEKHKSADNSRPKIIKDVLVLVATFILIIFFGGLAGLFANAYAGSHFGTTIGFIAAIGMSFLTGYLIKKGVDRIRNLSVFAKKQSVNETQ